MDSEAAIEAALAEADEKVNFEAAVDRMQLALDVAQERIASLSAALPDRLQLVSPWEIVTITTLAHMNQAIDMKKVCMMRDNEDAYKVVKFIYDEFSIQLGGYGSGDSDGSPLGTKRKTYFKNTAIINYSLSDERNKKSIKLFNNQKSDVGLCFFAVKNRPYDARGRAGPESITAALPHIDAACDFLNVLHESADDQKFKPVQLDVQLINSKFQLPIGIRLDRLQEILKPYQSSTCILTYDKDRHKGLKLEIKDGDLSKTTVFVFHTGNVLIAGDNNTTSSTAYDEDWGLPCAMANGFEFILNIVRKYEKVIATKLPKQTECKLAKRRLRK